MPGLAKNLRRAAPSCPSVSGEKPVVSPRISRIEDVHGPTRKIWRVDAQWQRTCEGCSQQRAIVVLEDVHRKATGECCDPAELPSARQLPRPTQLSKRKLIGVAHDEVVSNIETRKSPAGLRIKWIYLLTETRGIIERLAIGVAQQKLQRTAVVPEIYLKGVVGGISNCRKIAFARELIEPIRNVGRIMGTEWPAIIGRLAPRNARRVCDA